MHFMAANPSGKIDLEMLRCLCQNLLDDPMQNFVYLVNFRG